MKKILLLSIGLFFSSLACSQINYLPESGLSQYVYEKLDISTFRNSFGPKRSQGERLFSDLNLSPTEVSTESFTIESDTWLYKVKILEIKDINRDGVEDIEICFREKSKIGTYNAQKPLLITQLSDSSNLVALEYKVFGCEAYAK